MGVGFWMLGAGLNLRLSSRAASHCFSFFEREGVFVAGHIRRHFPSRPDVN